VASVYAPYAADDPDYDLRLALYREHDAHIPDYGVAKHDHLREMFDAGLEAERLDSQCYQALILGCLHPDSLTRPTLDQIAEVMGISAAEAYKKAKAAIIDIGSYYGGLEPDQSSFLKQRLDTQALLTGVMEFDLPKIIVSERRFLADDGLTQELFEFARRTNTPMQLKIISAGHFRRKDKRMSYESLATHFESYAEDIKGLEQMGLKALSLPSGREKGLHLSLPFNAFCRERKRRMIGCFTISLSKLYSLPVIQPPPRTRSPL